MAATLSRREPATAENPSARRVRRGSIAFPGGLNPCPECGRGFPSYRARRRHERRAHQGPRAGQGPVEDADRVLGGYVRWDGWRFIREVPGCGELVPHVHGSRTNPGARRPSDETVIQIAGSLGVRRRGGPLLLVAPGGSWTVERGAGG